MVGTAALKPDENGKYDKTILTITENGFGKRTDPSKFPLRGRGGKGVICHKLTEKTGALARLGAVSEEDDIFLITDGGTLIRTRVAQISETGRATSGVIVMRLNDGAKVQGFQSISDEDIDEIEETAEISEEEEAKLSEAQEIGDAGEEETEDAGEEDDDLDEEDDAEDEEEDDEGDA